MLLEQQKMRQTGHRNKGIHGDVALGVFGTRIEENGIRIENPLSALKIKLII
jgi:hypothetical protein